MNLKDNYFLDTEFNERIRPFSIDPISYGLTAEDGSRCYRVSSQFNERAAFPWLKDHVISKLPPVVERRSLEAIRAEMMGFIKPAKEIDIWAYNGATDAGRSMPWAKPQAAMAPP